MRLEKNIRSIRLTNLSKSRSTIFDLNNTKISWPTTNKYHHHRRRHLNSSSSSSSIIVVVIIRQFGGGVYAVSDSNVRYFGQELQFFRRVLFQNEKNSNLINETREKLLSRVILVLYADELSISDLFGDFDLAF